MSNYQAQNSIQSIEEILSDIGIPHPCLVLKNIFEEKIQKHGNDICGSTSYCTGHFTGSAILLSVDHKETLLIYHPSFKKWIQPGGHIEKGERIEDTILRETEEETGFLRESLQFIKEEDRYVAFLHVFDVPENPKKNRPPHQHFNICLFLTYNQETTVDDVSVSIEPLPTKWFSLSNIDQIETDEATKDLLRFAVSLL